MRVVSNRFVTALIFFGFFTIVHAWQTSFQLTGKTLVLGNISYFVPPTPVSQLKIGHDTKILSLLSTAAGDFDGEVIPITVIPTSNSSFGQAQLENIVNSYKGADDVFSESFLAGLYILFTGKGKPTVSLSFASRVFNTSLILKSPQYSGGIALSTNLPAGPYFLQPGSGKIFEALRLYDDEQQSFVYGTIPDGQGGYVQLNAHVPGAATESVAVPSRLYFTPTAQKPLAGLRLGVKDIYDIKGLHTGCGNRAFYDFYPPKNQTAPAVQRLLDGGMVLVGKTKTSQFANGEEATEDWVDLHAPYNPRGDGYQDGSSSSTGSGTAIAAYPWIDHTIGSDTGGSMRGPAGANGVFGTRPSHGAVVLDDVMPLSPELDTGGVFARDAKAWQTVGHWWYQNFTSFDKFPKTILFPTDTFGSSYLNNTPAAGTADAIFNDFIIKMEGFLGTNRTEINFAGMWNTSKPANSTAPSLRVLLNTTYADLISLDQIALVADPFINGFKALHGGRAPFINPAPTNRWGYGRTLPPTQKDDAIRNKTIFQNWFAENVVRPDNITCSESIFLYPQSDGSTNYRNQYGRPPTAPFGFSAGRIAVHAETPDMVVPIGELAYNSTVTNTTEFLPVTLSFIAAKNCDLMLFNMFAAMQDAGIIKPVMTGARMFSTESP